MALSVASFTANANWFSALLGGKSVTVSWSAGDAIIVFGAMETDVRDFVAPTATGLTFTQYSLQDGAGTSNASAGLWGAIAGSSGTNVTVTLNANGATQGGLAVWVITGGPSSIVGTTGNQNESAFSITTTAGDVVIYGLADWNATNPPGKTPATGSGTATERFDTGNGSTYAVWGAEWVGTAAGTFSFGPNNYTSLQVAQVALRVLPPAGGTDYTKTPADPIGITDARTVLRTSDRSPADPVGVTDSATRAATATRTAADGVAVADSVTRVIGRTATRNDPTGITDSVTVAVARARTVTDTAGITDARTLARTSARTVADPVGVTSSPVAQLGQSVANPVGVTDAVAVTMATARTVADPVGVTDSAGGDLSGSHLELLNVFARASADPHNLTITGATAGRDVWLIVNTAAVVTTPAGWTDEADRVATMATYIYRLDGASNPGGSIGVTLDLSAARALAAVAIEAKTYAAGTLYASLVAPVNFGTTDWGTSAHTFTTRDDVLAIYAFHTAGATPAAFTATSYDQGFTPLADTDWAGTGGSGDEAARVLVGFGVERAFTAGGVVVTLSASQTTGSAVGFLAFDLDTGLSGVKADPIGVTDAVARTAASVRTPSDSIGLADARTVVATATRTTANPVGVTDAVTAVLGQLVANPVGVTDARTVLRTSARTVANPVGVTDSVSVNLTSGGTNYTRTVADAVGVTDTGSPQTIDFGYTVADPAGVTDSATRSLAAVRARNDAVGVTDGASSSIGGGGGTNYTRTPADPVGITDARTVARTMPRSPADAVGVTDAAGRVLARARTQADAVGLVDTVLVVRTTARTVADPVGVTDTAFVPGAAPPWSWLVSTGAGLVEHTPLLDGVHPATADVT